VAYLDGDAAAADRAFWRAWNGAADGAPIDFAWRVFVAARRAIDRHARDWSARLATLPDLAAGLVEAARRWYD
jgi:hypothetical protein